MNHETEQIIPNIELTISAQVRHAFAPYRPFRVRWSSNGESREAGFDFRGDAERFMGSLWRDGVRGASVTGRAEPAERNVR